jgi:hypothetical protein
VEKEEFCEIGCREDGFGWEKLKGKVMVWGDSDQTRRLLLPQRMDDLQSGESNQTRD